MKKLLIATTNEGKFKEIASELADLPFKIISLKDLLKKIKEPQENRSTIEANAILKAKYYAAKTGLLTLADDGGLFIDALDGWPGVNSARVAKTNNQRLELILKKMKGLTGQKRKAIFKVNLVLHNPQDNTSFISYAELAGLILNQPVKNGDIAWGYNSIFYVPNIKKTYGEMTILEKNLISHRGQAIIKLKLYLMKQYSFKQYLVPVGVIIQDKKMLLTKRRDFRKEYNDQWEFPGGGVDKGETIKQNLIREVKEETGYNIEIIEQLPEIMSEVRDQFNYQVFLLAYICKIKSGEFKTADNEVSDHGWYSLAQALKKPLLPLNKKLLQNKNNQTTLKKYIN